MLGICMGLMTALLLRKTALQGPKTSFVIMLPEFRRPNLHSVLIQLLTRIRVFLERAGTVIFSVAVIVWALAYYPQSDVIASHLAEQKASISTGLSIEEYEVISRKLDNQAAADQLAQSWLGRTGKFIAPVFHPLGWDWKISSAVIAGFPAREVVIPVLATIYAVENTDDGVNLSDRLKSAKFPDGSLIFTLPMVLGLLIFYAFCLQCVATLAVIRRETNSIALPLLAWIYMTSLGYLGAFIVYQIGIN
jgi:ferrous iron transport protein B